MKRHALAVFLAGTMLFGCISVPREGPREHPLDQFDLGLGTTAEPREDAAWWRAYGDPQLDRLMQQALSDNPTLAQAISRVRQAQAAVDLARAGLAPSVSYDAAEARQRLSRTDAVPPVYGGGVYWRGRQTLDLSWEVDFWGRQASLVREARSEMVASDLDAASARLALQGAVLHAYVDLDRNFALADVADSSATQRTQILDITRRRVQAGLDTNVELREAEGAVPQALVELRQAQSDRDGAVHMLAALAGHGADTYKTVERPRWRVEAVLQLPTSLPADLLGRRPDVLAARSRVEVASAGRDAVKAGFYPDVNLSAFAGTASIGLANLFHARDSGAYGAGPAIHLPVFDAGHLKAQYRGATAEIDAAVASYNETVLSAIRETSDQITRVDALADQLEQQHRSLESAEAAYRLAKERYQAGLSDYLTVLNAETQVLSARRQRIELLSAQARARVELLLAIGGSFDPNVQTHPVAAN